MRRQYRAIRPVPDRRIERGLNILRFRPNANAAELAKRVNLSTSYFQHLFKRHVGASVSKHALNRRLERAAKLLRKTFRSVKEISNEVGFRHAANFNHSFQRYFGMSPTTFRKIPEAEWNNK